MARKSRSSGLAIAVLHVHNKSVIEILDITHSCLQNMGANPLFQSLNPSLAEVQAQYDKLYSAYLNSKTKTIGTAEMKRYEFSRMLGVLRRLTVAVSCVANANLAQAHVIIKSAGMEIKKTPSPPNRIFTAIRGKKEGSVKLSTRAIPRSTCIYQMTNTPMIASSWETIYSGPNVAFEINGLEIGKNYYFRYAHNVKGTMTAWSHVLKVIPG
jgi:hypothetical protein